MFLSIADTSAFMKIIKKMQTENIKSMKIKDKAADDYNEVFQVAEGSISKIN
jgi:hypothetical protein